MSIPVVKHDEKSIPTLYVHDKPFFMRSGEIHKRGRGKALARNGLRIYKRHERPSCPGQYYPMAGHYFKKS